MSILNRSKLRSRDTSDNRSFERWYCRHKVTISFAIISVLLAVLGIMSLLGYTHGIMDTWRSGLSNQNSYFNETLLKEPPFIFLGTSTSVDVVGGTLSMEWIIVDSYTIWWAIPTLNRSQLSTKAANFYIDGQFSFFHNGTNNIILPNPPGHPDYVCCGSEWNPSQMTISTTHNLSYQWHGAHRQRAESAVYPFDRYNAYTTIEAFDAASNASIPVAAIHTVGGVSGFVLSSAGHPASTTRSTDGLFVVLSSTRNDAVKAFAILLFLTNWALTLDMLLIAVVAFLHMAELPDSVMLLPLTVVLAIPALRNAMPGAPDFGMFLDICGYFINLIAVVMFTMFTTVYVVLDAMGKARSQEQPGVAQIAHPKQCGLATVNSDTSDQG